MFSRDSSSGKALMMASIFVFRPEVWHPCRKLSFVILFSFCEGWGVLLDDMYRVQDKRLVYGCHLIWTGKPKTHKM